MIVIVEITGRVPQLCEKNKNSRSHRKFLLPKPVVAVTELVCDPWPEKERKRTMSEKNSRAIEGHVVHNAMIDRMIYRIERIENVCFFFATKDCVDFCTRPKYSIEKRWGYFFDCLVSYVVFMNKKNKCVMNKICRLKRESCERTRRSHHQYLIDLIYFTRPHSKNRRRNNISKKLPVINRHSRI